VCYEAITHWVKWVCYEANYSLSEVGVLWSQLLTEWSWCAMKPLLTEWSGCAMKPTTHWVKWVCYEANYSLSEVGVLWSQLLTEWSGCAMKPTTHLHLVVSSGISGAIPLHSPFLHVMHRNNFTFRQRWKSRNHHLSPTHQTSVYSHVPHNDISVNDGPHVRRCSHKIIIL